MVPHKHVHACPCTRSASDSLMIDWVKANTAFIQIVAFQCYFQFQHCLSAASISLIPGLLHVYTHWQNQSKASDWFMSTVLQVIKIILWSKGELPRYHRTNQFRLLPLSVLKQNVKCLCTACYHSHAYLMGISRSATDKNTNSNKGLLY